MKHILFIIIVISLASCKSSVVKDYSPSTDEECLELIMAQEPGWTQEKAEDFLFLSEEDFNNRYYP